MKVKSRAAIMLVLTCMVAFILSVPAFAASDFSDVPAGSPYYDGVRYLSEKGITEGTGSNIYSPDTPITVRQWAAMLCRAVYPDVVTDETAPDEECCIRRGYAAGWLTETALFEPESPMCLGVLMQSLLQAMDCDIYSYELYPGGTRLSKWDNALRIATELGLCSEDVGTAEIVTRGEAAVLLQRALTTEYDIPEPPIVEAFPIVNESGVPLDAYLLELSRVPESLLHAYVDAGWDFLIDFEYIAQFSDTLGGSCVGVTSFRNRRIVVSDDCAIIHEFGHFLDYALHFPAKHKALFIGEAQEASEVLSYYSTTNHREYFAEYFAYWIHHRENPEKMERLDAASPQTYAYFASLEAQNWCTPAA